MCRWGMSGFSPAPSGSSPPIFMVGSSSSAAVAAAAAASHPSHPSHFFFAAAAAAAAAAASGGFGPSACSPLSHPAFYMPYTPATAGWHHQFRRMSPNMLLAIDAVRTGKMGFTQAGKTYGVNGRTLWVYYRKLGYAVHNTFRGKKNKLASSTSSSPAAVTYTTPCTSTSTSSRVELTSVPLERRVVNSIGSDFSPASDSPLPLPLHLQSSSQISITRLPSRKSNLNNNNDNSNNNNNSESNDVNQTLPHQKNNIQDNLRLPLPFEIPPSSSTPPVEDDDSLLSPFEDDVKDFESITRQFDPLSGRNHPEKIGDVSPSEDTHTLNDLSIPSPNSLMIDVVDSPLPEDISSPGISHYSSVMDSCNSSQVRHQSQQPSKNIPQCMLNHSNSSSGIVSTAAAAPSVTSAAYCRYTNSSSSSSAAPSTVVNSFNSNYSSAVTTTSSPSSNVFNSLYSMADGTSSVYSASAMNAFVGSSSKAAVYHSHNLSSYSQYHHYNQQQQQQQQQQNQQHQQQSHQPDLLSHQSPFQHSSLQSHQLYHHHNYQHHHPHLDGEENANTTTIESLLDSCAFRNLWGSSI